MSFKTFPVTSMGSILKPMKREITSTILAVIYFIKKKKKKNKKKEKYSYWEVSKVI